MPLSDDLRRIAEAAVHYADPGEELSGIVASEPSAGVRVYLCAFAVDGMPRSWLAFDHDARPVEKRRLLRDALSVAALCELADEMAAGGDLDELHARLVSLRLTEAPAGIEAAEEALLALQRAVAAAPGLASPARLDEVGAATRRLEQTLGGNVASPFAEGMKQAMHSVESLTKDVEANYKRALR
jgi:hypothetical protein